MRTVIERDSLKIIFSTLDTRRANVDRRSNKKSPEGYRRTRRSHASSAQKRLKHAMRAPAMSHMLRAPTTTALRRGGSATAFPTILRRAKFSLFLNWPGLFQIVDQICVSCAHSFPTKVNYIDFPVLFFGIHIINCNVELVVIVVDDIHHEENQHPGFTAVMTWLRNRFR
ncbi:hypothetical protein [Burkholderia sp. ABCPW 14]|uniref:hypothetical protein n=1 Tax=Burkholderia sp. ABCPW 14 TaxID=1637860 RepID=UPI0012E36DEC|nr:hypothetical protein [Burkholderia sp. ABCPW 14]